MKSDGLAKLRFDTIVSSVEALALAYASCMMNKIVYFGLYASQLCIKHT